MAGSKFTITDVLNMWPEYRENTDLDLQESPVKGNDTVYPGVTEIITMNLKDVLDLKIDSLKNAILFLKNFPKCCSIKTEHDERAKYEPWTNRKDIFFTKLGITPYISNPDDKNNKKEYNQWHLETVKLAGELIKDYSVVSFYKAIADADMK